MQLDTLDELKLALNNISETTGPIVLRVHADWCPRCPEVGEVVRDLNKHRVFELFDVNAESGGEIVHHLNIMKLPAVVVLLSPHYNESPLQLQAASSATVVKMLTECTRPRFSLDEDF